VVRIDTAFDIPMAGQSSTPADSWIKAAHDPAESRYGGAVDVQRAADLYAQGRALRQIGAELGVSRATVSEQLRQAGGASSFVR
jgi:hypothetical protein